MSMTVDEGVGIVLKLLHAVREPANQLRRPAKETQFPWKAVLKTNEKTCDQANQSGHN